MDKSAATSADVISKKTDAAEAEEQARLAQQKAIIDETAVRTKEVLLQALQEVFQKGDKGEKSMVVLWDRVPILCRQVEIIHDNIKGMQTDIATIKEDQAEVKPVLESMVAKRIIRQWATGGVVFLTAVWLVLQIYTKLKGA